MPDLLFVLHRGEHVREPHDIPLVRKSRIALGTGRKQVHAAAESVQGIIQDAVSAQQDAEKPTVELVVNTVKSPIFANTVQSSMAGALAGAGINVEVTSVGEASEDASPLSGMIGVQMAVMPLMVLSLTMSLIAFVVLHVQDTERTHASKARMTGIQVAYALVASLVAALAAFGIVSWLRGLGVPAQAILLLWLASFCIMLANFGLLSISIPLGALVMVCVFALGMGTAILPPEMLPTFWADWVYPWGRRFPSATACAASSTWAADLSMQELLA
ncbi:hypothetical protein [Slackia heliotrinireducens]|uniref:DUF3533 domain-containing protein n=1 Tax=Slackia heliotrinireducens (strain ATCC 29202 / DSM 20476 / NCTC 11029 / RHS 1) TaxID=471855 RepID=C7N480_SLAHD|nr:hypothetical protein [Slackia heliotrinireducens]ACV23816.1 hypothetical protein Shel_28260 [Slackia heliotrinireducens DSM 20476]